MFKLDIERMKEQVLSDTQAKELIFDSFAFHPIMPRRFLPEVAKLYFMDDKQREMFPDRTLWSLNNAFTEVTKTLAALPQQKRRSPLAGRLGEWFAARRPTTCFRWRSSCQTDHRPRAEPALV